MLSNLSEKDFSPMYYYLYVICLSRKDSGPLFTYCYVIWFIDKKNWHIFMSSNLLTLVMLLQLANSADPDQLASSDANWSRPTLFAKAGHIRVQQDQG